MRWRKGQSEVDTDTCDDNITGTGSGQGAGPGSPGRGQWSDYSEFLWLLLAVVMCAMLLMSLLA